MTNPGVINKMPPARIDAVDQFVVGHLARVELGASGASTDALVLGEPGADQRQQDDQRDRVQRADRCRATSGRRSRPATTRRTRRGQREHGGDGTQRPPTIRSRSRSSSGRSATANTCRSRRRPTSREAERRLRRIADDTAPRLGLSRRDFLPRSCGGAAALFVLAACQLRVQAIGRSKNRVARSRSRGPRRPIPTKRGPCSAATSSSSTCKRTCSTSTKPTRRRRRRLRRRASRTRSAAKSDWRDCFGIDHWFRELFVRSDTTMAVISAVPILGADNPLSIEVMERAKSRRQRRVRRRRPGVPARPGESERRRPRTRNSTTCARVAAEHPIGAWKVYTHVPGGRGWYLDDHDADAVQCGQAFLDVVREVGPKIVCVHKGLGGEQPVLVAGRHRPGREGEPRHHVRRVPLGLRRRRRRSVLRRRTATRASTGSSRRSTRPASNRTRTCTPSSVRRGST